MKTLMTSHRSPLTILRSRSAFILIALALGAFALVSTSTAFGVVPAADGGYPGGNTAEGDNALLDLTTGANNTAIGQGALFSNTTGSNNTANGVDALANNTTGSFNTANGFTALFHNTLLSNTTGNHNTANGDIALLDNTTGNFNTATGARTLVNNTTGSFNIAMGINAGNNLTTGNNDIDIGNGGVAGESATTRIGTAGIQFKTPGLGLSQAPPSGGTQGGLAVLFGNPNYAKIFRAFSLSRLFTPVGSNITNASFSIPGTNGNAPAAVRGFGAVFTDVDQPDGTGTGGSTLIEYFDKNGKLLFSSFVPAAPGDGSLSFFGIKFDDARIASVRIKTGDVAPGPNDDGQHDIVMMDDFIYGEPQLLQ